MIYDFIEIEHSNSKAMYEQLYEQIRLGIDNKLIESGVRLPSIRNAAIELQVSRTTIENAYFRLCNEGYLENRPQRGFFVKTPPQKNLQTEVKIEKTISYLYDFSSTKIDVSVADIPIWKKYLRQVLNKEEEIVAYGEAQGEYCLRKAISNYSYSARAVISTADQIVIGAGIQALISIFCCINEKTIVAFEYPGFKQAEQVFKDYGFKVVIINDPNHPELKLENSNADIYFHIASLKLKTSAANLHAERERIGKWLKLSDKHYLIEDDFNGELRFKTRLIPIMQTINPERVIYMGSFSKLLLPSVRIAYAVLHEKLLKRYLETANYYNQTASKIEQIALSEYINDGYLEKHLRRLKKLYLEKSEYLLRLINDNFENAEAKILESSLAIVFNPHLNLSDEEIETRCDKALIKVDSINNGLLRLNFAGIKLEQMEDATLKLKEALS